MKPFVISREYDAPRERVWQAWTEAERLKEWFAPAGMKSIHSKLDLRPGGLYHQGRGSLNQGWGCTLDHLTDYLKKG